MTDSSPYTLPAWFDDGDTGLIQGFAFDFDGRGQFEHWDIRQFSTCGSEVYSDNHHPRRSDGKSGQNRLCFAMSSWEEAMLQHEYKKYHRHLTIDENIGPLSISRCPVVCKRTS